MKREFFPTSYLVKYSPFRKANVTDRVTTMNRIHVVDCMLSQRPINIGPIMGKTRISYFTLMQNRGDYELKLNLRATLECPDEILTEC